MYSKYEVHEVAILKDSDSETILSHLRKRCPGTHLAGSEMKPNPGSGTLPTTDFIVIMWIKVLLPPTPVHYNNYNNTENISSPSPRINRQS